MTGEPFPLYLDTSALACLYTAEPGLEVVRAAITASSGVAVHLITYTEIQSTLAGRLRRKLMRKAAYQQAVDAFEADWARLTHIGVDLALVRQAGALTRQHQLRAYDALHLAAALTLAPLGARFLTFDHELQRAAAAELPSYLLVSPE